jgi:hypothetical protein
VSIVVGLGNPSSAAAGAGGGGVRLAMAYSNATIPPIEVPITCGLVQCRWWVRATQSNAREEVVYRPGGVLLSPAPRLSIVNTWHSLWWQWQWQWQGYAGQGCQ